MAPTTSLTDAATLIGRSCKPRGGRGVPLATRKELVDAEAARLTGTGATVLRVLDTAGVDHYAVVMQDPEGNEFCLS